jgi:hypothetical protein
MFIHAGMNPECSEGWPDGLQALAGGRYRPLDIFHPKDMKSNAEHFQSREN